MKNQNTLSAKTNRNSTKGQRLADLTLEPLSPEQNYAKTSLRLYNSTSTAKKASLQWKRDSATLKRARGARLSQASSFACLTRESDNAITEAYYTQKSFLGSTRRLSAH